MVKQNFLWICRAATARDPNLNQSTIEIAPIAIGGGQAMKTFVFGGMILWLICGVVGAWLEGQDRVDVPTILGGPVTLWHGLNQPADNWVS
jgi:hypothetical protein